jgi:type II secretory pathway component PulF
MDAHGKETKGTLEVSSQNEAIGRVKEMGLFPTKIVELDRAAEKSEKKADKKGGKAAAKGGKKGQININIKIPGLSGRVKSKVLTTFTRQLATLVDAGLPLLRGLRVLEKQERNPTLKSIIAELALSIEGGSTFSEGLAQHPKVFNRLYVNMVKAGELGGVLEVVLTRWRSSWKSPENQGQGRRRHVLPPGRSHRRRGDSLHPHGQGDSFLQVRVRRHVGKAPNCRPSPAWCSASATWSAPISS